MTKNLENLRNQSIRTILKNSAPTEADIGRQEAGKSQKYSKANSGHIKIGRPNFRLDVRIKLHSLGKEFTMGSKCRFIGTCIYNPDSPIDPKNAMDEFKSVKESIMWSNTKYKGETCTLLNIGDTMDENHEADGGVILKTQFKDSMIMFNNVFELEEPFSKVDNICQICEIKRLGVCKGCF